MKRAIWMFLAMSASIFGTISFMLENQTHYLPDQTGKIFGIGCFMASGLFWMMYGVSYRAKPDPIGKSEPSP